MLLNPTLSNTVRGNYSTQTSALSYGLNSFGGATPPSASLLLGPLPSQQSLALFYGLDTTLLFVGSGGKNRTKQANFTDDLSISAGAHQLKFGADYRAIFLNADPYLNEAFYLALSTQNLLSTGSAYLSTSTALPAKLLVQSFSLYGQDTWRVTPRLTLTYGLRWELNPAPSARGGTKLAAWENTNNPAEIALAPFGTPLWSTTYGNFGPRFGFAYSLTSSGDFVVRAGAGTFYDLGVGSSAGLASSFPNFVSSPFSNVSLPVADLTSLLPVISFLPPYVSGVRGFAADLKLPRSYQWNGALEKSLGGKQVISLTYVGQAGRDLLRNEIIAPPNANFKGPFQLTLNQARSNYSALQVQYRRPLASRLQALVNYTWGHSLDNVSQDVSLEASNAVVSRIGDYASSDSDVRQTFSGALNYDVPAAARSGPLAVFTKDWSLNTVVVARSGFPFNAVIPAPASFGGVEYSRPDLVPGQPLYLRGSQCASVFQGLGVLQQGQTCPGGQGLNPNAFSIPSTPRQGTESRNDIRGFGLTQVDVSIGRRFPIGERLNLQFRADAFNVLNHPNFANPSAQVNVGPSALLSTQMLNQGLGGLAPIFQQGGPRSLQLSLKLNF